ncbi:Golgi apparatus protein 1 [Fopius arisanus]|uniref:Golgi apparatus protein 1 n=1 Tax=Fopius arisanus TaxID=64838 RepID=A0A9R1T3Q5_9HYME|nr:PREDICTED: Golgi apparatus protein 1 [Fopius arisanus]
MEFSRRLAGVGIALLFQVLSDILINAGVLANDVTQGVNSPEYTNVGWVFGNDELSRRRRNVVVKPPDEGGRYFIEDKKCRDSFERLCGVIDNNNDDLFILQCVQTFKTNEAYMIDEDCQHLIWKHIVNITENENIEQLTRKECGEEIDDLQCQSKNKEPGTYLACLIEKRENVKNAQCSEFIQRLEFVAFSDFRIITPMVTDCQQDINSFKCGRIQPHRDVSQGQMLSCLQAHVDKLEPKCRKRIFKISEIQSDNIKLDRQLFLACMQDHIKFCPNIRPGSGQVYKCLMQHKLDRTMSKQCQDQLARREKLIASDYKASKGLVKACKDDIKTNHCRRSVSDDKEIKLAQILLCLETAAKNGSKIDAECQKEMFDHRKILLEDYHLSPEIVDGCAKDISRFCNGLEQGGVTIHCLMEHTKSRKQKNKVLPECQRALETLIKETDAGEDWRVDPVLHDACQPVVDSSCRDVQGGNARVIYCLMDKLGTDRMLEACETALLQIQYFVARDYKLDPQLYKACRNDAVQLCNAKIAWNEEGSLDPERGPLVLSCLYRYADHQKNATLRPECLQEIKRIMRQRAISVDLQPEIEQACFQELADNCYDKTAKGEEILCLQDNLDELNEKCKQAVNNLTEDQAERVELNPIIMAACRKAMDKHCEDVLKNGKDEGDMMECLIEHKNDLDSHFEYKCKAAIEHFQIISLKNYHFTYKFKEACRPYVNRFCHRARTKAEVIECLSDILREDIMKDSQHRILKDCRQQLRGQLYQQRENIKLDPLLQKACQSEIKQYCFNIEAGHSQILECLASRKAKLSSICHKQLFKVRQQEFLDSSSDFLLWNTCRSMIGQFCQREPDKSKVLDCLKGVKDEDSFDEKCKDVVVRRMIEQNTDYRFNGALHAACAHDIVAQCDKVVHNEPADKELEGKVIRCLRIKFREGKLRPKCQKQMTVILKQAAHNYHLNPLLVSMCSHEIHTICHSDEDDSDTVEECLKMQFNKGNPEMREECRVEIADLIEEARADIHFDPLLHKACSNDVAKYCSDIAQGSGRHIMCLQNIMDDGRKPLDPDCFKMLSKRIEMFKNVAKLHLPNTIEELYTTVNQSPSRRYFLIVAFTLIGIIFIMGLFCGRITRRTMMMKNK